jgi:protein tyrosine phosphatase (PTP) superfamily phosphohydrolase (DUF442 family)
VLSGTGQPSEDNDIAPAKPRRSPTRRSAAEGTPLWFLLLVSIVVPGGFYGVVIARGNFHEVVPHRVYRSGQPSPEQLRVWIQRYGLKTIVSLRGTASPVAAEEEAVATSMGADMVHLSLAAHELMSSQTLVQLIEVLQTAKEPMLIHCYHGVDRAGTASAIAAWLLGGQPYDRAKWQAYVPGPWKHPSGADHISDVLTLYEDYCRDRGLSPDDPSLFKHWARDIYRPYQSNSATMGVWSLGRSPVRGSASM